MLKVTFIAFFTFITALAYTQQVFFVYIQSDARQPFYTRVNGKLHSSTAAGYLVIPRLTMGEYRLQVGFPKSSQPEMDFMCKVEGKDQGYTLKNFGDKGWGLFNLQSFDVQMAGTAVATANPGGQENNYSNLLAQVVKDPSVKDVKVDKTPPPVPVKIVPAIDTPVIIQQPAAIPVQTSPVIDTPVLVQQPVTPPVQMPASLVTTLFSKGGAEGTDAVYVVQTGTETDTVRVFIPLVKSKTVAAPPPPVQDTVAVTQVIQDPPPPVQDTPVKQPAINPNDGKFLQFEVKSPHTKPADTLAVKPVTDPPAPVVQAPSPVDTPKKAPSALIMFNTDCRKIAGEDDFIKLRKAMAGERTDDDMVEAARKAFKQRCYLLQHIKGLAGLLSTDEARYKLFDAAYAHTYDTDQYKTLGQLLTDEYYITRFNAMIRK